MLKAEDIVINYLSCPHMNFFQNRLVAVVRINLSTIRKLSYTIFAQIYAKIR